MELNREQVIKYLTIATVLLTYLTQILSFLQGYISPESAVTVGTIITVIGMAILAINQLLSVLQNVAMELKALRLKM